MKTLDSYIIEKLVIGKNIIHKKIKVSSKDELKEILKERLVKDKNANFNDLDVGQITNMGNLFNGLDPYNIKIDKWDVSQVKVMNYMFNGCKNFNCDLSKWNVSNVLYMDGMFANCWYFNSDLSNWNVSNVENIAFMFYGCKNFNSDLNNWDVSNVHLGDMCHTFDECDSLKNKPSWYKP